ncbi:MAG: hypothetical protein MUE74_14185, partial [Bacteroidales bacterium]|nr:hypothetical protein [Bacteroidales bacterium]
MKEFSSLISQNAVMANLEFAIILPIVAGLILLLIPDKARQLKGILALLVSLVAGILTFGIYESGTARFIPDLWDIGKYLAVRIDNLSRMVVMFISLFAILVLLYSLVYMKVRKIRNYYPWILITLGCSYGAVLADNLLLFLGFWGALGITLYKLIQGSDEESSATAKKTLIMIGASDSIMIIGIALVWKMTGTLNMSEISLDTGNALTVTAFLALLAGSFTKAGAFPFHTWVPDYAKDAPASSSAFLPASLD